MPSLLVAVAEAVKETLNGTTAQNGFGLKFKAERIYMPRFEVKDLQELRVSVVPSKSSAVQVARGGASQRDLTVDVGIHRVIAQGRLSEFDFQAETDPLMALAEEIGDLFRGKALSGVPGSMCVGTENQVIYDVQHMSEHRVFFTVVNLNFKVLP